MYSYIISFSNIRPIADKVAQNLENISKDFQLSARCTRILMGFIISTMSLRGTNCKSHAEFQYVDRVLEIITTIDIYI